MQVDKKSLQQIKEVVTEVFEQKFTQSFDAAFDRKFPEAFDNAFDRKFPEAFDRSFNVAFDRSFNTAFDDKIKPFSKKLDSVYDETIRIMVNIAELKYDDVEQIKSTLESVQETLEEHDVKLTRIVRLMPDVKCDLMTLQERVTNLERHTGLKSAA